MSKYDRLPIEDKALIWSVVDLLIEKLDEFKASKDDLLEVFDSEEVRNMFGKDDELAKNKMYQVFIDRSEALEYYELCSVLKDLQTNENKTT